MRFKWPLLTLREVNVSLIDCEHRTPAAADSGYPYIAIPQVKEGRLDIAGARRISQDHFIEWTRKAKPQAYDVVLSRRCNPGETAFVPPYLECALGQNLVLLRADGAKVFPPFLRWLVRSPAWWEQVNKYINAGAVFDSLKCADIPNFEFPIPSLEEQRIIDSILASLDDKIELNRQINQTLEQIAQAIFKSWFVDFEPVKAKIQAREALTPALSQRERELIMERAAMCAISGKSDVELDQLPSEQFDQIKATAALFPDELVESELGEIPKGWGIGTVDTDFHLTMGQSPPGETYNDVGKGAPFYQGRTDFGFRFPTRRVYCTVPTRMAENGDTLISVRAPVGDINMASENCCIGRGVAAARHKSGSRSYTFYFMQSLKAEFAKYEADGTVFGSIGKKDFNNLQCVIPDSRLIEECERYMFPFDQNIENNEEQTITLIYLRDSLLPKLLSGEIAVGNIGC